MGDRHDATTPRREPPVGLDLLATRVLDAAFEVHRVLGPGFGELVYENALCIELEERRVAFARQSRILVQYKGRCVGEGRADIVVADELVLELKAIDALAAIHTAQLLAYLKATGRQLGLLINFNVLRLAQGIRRVVLTPSF